MFKFLSAQPLLALAEEQNLPRSAETSGSGAPSLLEDAQHEKKGRTEMILLRRLPTLSAERMRAEQQGMEQERCVRVLCAAQLSFVVSVFRLVWISCLNLRACVRVSASASSSHTSTR
jgi:hypothetical protein